MTNGLQPLRRVKLQALALIGLSFLVGALVGGTIEHFRLSDSKPKRTSLRHLKVLPRQYERLDLTPEQRERIEEIIERRRPRSDSILQEVLPTLRAITDSVRAEVRTVLTAEQRAELDDYLKRRRDRKKRHRSSKTDDERDRPNGSDAPADTADTRSGDT